MHFKHYLAIILTVAFALVTSVVGAQDENTIPPADLTNPQAAFIYSHDFAISKGATAEFRKMEGVAVDTVHNKIYYAITEVGKGMSDTAGDIQLPANKCGMVLEGDLDADFNVSALKPVVIGGPYDESNADYACSQDSIASPDNLFVDAKGNLWIGEDTDFHHNQMLWMWDGTTLKRFATYPEGAEVTGVRTEPDGTLFINVQHPDATNVYPFNRATVGVVTDFKAGDDFTSVEIPTGDAMKSIQLAAGDYQVLARTGEPIPGSEMAGDFFGEISAKDGSVLNTCNNPDGNMFLPTDSKGAQGYLYTNWECYPGGVSKLYIQQDASGNWKAVEGDRVDFTGVGGTWSNCNASVTPWNTGLTSEEYAADKQADWEEGWLASKDAIASFLGHPGNPLDFGYIVELTPAGGEEDGIGTVVTKHYAMGRFSHENAFVMPDGKTAYFGDDGTDRILYKFVADTAGDLSAGTLYAAKVTQDKDTLNLNWIMLGTGNDKDIAAAIRATDQPA